MVINGIPVLSTKRVSIFDVSFRFPRAYHQDGRFGSVDIIDSLLDGFVFRDWTPSSGTAHGDFIRVLVGDIFWQFR